MLPPRVGTRRVVCVTSSAQKLFAQQRARRDKALYNPESTPCEGEVPTPIIHRRHESAPCEARFLKDDYTLRVEINDFLDIFCPHYDPRVPAEHTESFVLYMVDRQGYDACHVTPDSNKRWECNRPHAPLGPIKFSEKIQRYTPFSLGSEFTTGKDYYYISIPDADSVGDCMKLRLSVCCRPTTVRPLTEVPKSQPRGGSPGGGGRSPSGGDPASQSRLFSLLSALCLLLLV
ncbi:ephrin-A4-like [Mantella aurantiaca]